MFKNLFCKHGSFPVPNKYWELEAFISSIYWKMAEFTLFEISDVYVFRSALNLFGCLGYSFEWTKNRDHAGLSIEGNVLWLSVGFRIYDCRHWDDGKDEWVRMPLDEINENGNPQEIFPQTGWRS